MSARRTDECAAQRSTGTKKAATSRALRAGFANYRHLTDCVAEKAGFSYEGLLRNAGQIVMTWDKTKMIVPFSVM